LPKISCGVEVRDRILVESGLLFGRYGIKSMTMDSLAEELGISKRTIYEHFRDKDTLLLEVIRYYKNLSKEEAHELIEQSDNAIEALFRIIKMSVAQITRTNPSFFHDIKKYHQNILKEFSEPGQIRDMSITRRLLETGIEQEVFRNDIHLEIVNQTIHTLFELFGPDSRLVLSGFSHKDIFNQVLIPYFRGISTKKGRKLLVDCKTILE
jgi:TetR/AcrR family transcriptional regulator, cholesterol catabolism regulator